VTDAIRRLRAEVAAGPVPAHVGIIMDGNGRWAEARDLPRIEGHREGSRSVRAVTTCAREIGVKALTLYAFSSQNWSRPADEVAGLMGLLAEYLGKERPTLLKNDIRLQAIGDLERLPAIVRLVLDEVRHASRENRSMVLTLALSYGGREELVQAARALAKEVQAGRLRPEDIDESALEQRLSTSDLPPLDLCIRTSGELRISNFLLWQVAYSEIVVTDVAWPEFREEAFLEALLEYRRRERRFGLTSAQVRRPPPG
jgi:undecaprenyl diphosphate synthase